MDSCPVRYTATNGAFVGVIGDFVRYTSATVRYKRIKIKMSIKIKGGPRF